MFKYVYLSVLYLFYVFFQLLVSVHAVSVRVYSLRTNKVCSCDYFDMFMSFVFLLFCRIVGE